MPIGWTFAGESSTFGSAAGVVTLVEGATFCLSNPAGDVVPGLPHGLFFRDTRLLSGWQLFVDGEPPDALSTSPREPFATTFVGRGRPGEGRADSTLLVLRHRYVGDGMREDVVLRNVGAVDVRCRLEVVVEADFADLFEVKESRVVDHGRPRSWADHDGLHIERPRPGDPRGIRVAGDGWTAHANGGLTATVVVPARGEWTGTVQVHPTADGVETPVRYPSDLPVERAEPARRLQEWHHSASVLRCDDEGFTELVARSVEDLGALRIVDPVDPAQVAVAAGAPWFMTVFGRDSLLTAWMALPVDQGLARGTLRTLARHQGTVVDARRDEQPGRILHEIRHGMDSVDALGGGTVYYGSVDATPLFVMLLGELYRWGHRRSDVDALLPAADRALDWVERYGDRDGDGFVEYLRSSEHGLLHQGWKDSFDGISYADGRLAEPPLALAEVQGYTYAAYVARAEIAVDLGDPRTADRCSERAAALKAAFNRDFWLPERGYYAVALDPDKQPVDSLASNMGHCLWTGIVDDDRAASVAAALTGPEMFTGWGVRTLADDHGRLQPDELPQRIGLAARQRDRGRRADALRVRGGGAAGGARPRRCGGGVRRSAARAVLRLRPDRVRAAGPLPDVVLTAGVGCGQPAAAAPVAAAARPRPPAPPGRSRPAAAARARGAAPGQRPARHRAGRTDGGRRRGGRHRTAQRRGDRVHASTSDGATGRSGVRSQDVVARRHQSPDPEGRGTSASLEAISADRHS